MKIFLDNGTFFCYFVITNEITGVITMAKSDYIRIRIHADLKQAFKQVAKKKNRDMSELLVDYIKDETRNGKR